jgi:hypothetical protein
MVFVVIVVLEILRKNQDSCFFVKILIALMMVFSVVTKQTNKQTNKQTKTKPQMAGAWEMAQQIKVSLCKHEDLSSNLRNPCRAEHSLTHLLSLWFNGRIERRNKGTQKQLGNTAVSKRACLKWTNTQTCQLISIYTQWHTHT